MQLKMNMGEWSSLDTNTRAQLNPYVTTRTHRVIIIRAPVDVVATAFAHDAALHVYKEQTKSTIQSTITGDSDSKE